MGAASVTSWFDHESASGNVFARYDGRRWTNPPDAVDVVNCNTGVNCYDGHTGTDFAADYQPVLAAADGIVVSNRYWFVSGCHSGEACGYGMFIDIDHGNGYITRYGHLSAIAVTPGQAVQKGQIIGTSGSTGNSGGPHLHFGVRRPDNTPVDPFGWPDPPNDPSGVANYWLWSLRNWVKQDPNGISQWGGNPEVYYWGKILAWSADMAEKDCLSGGGCPNWHAAIDDLGQAMYWVPVNSSIDYNATWSTAGAPEEDMNTRYFVYAVIPASTNASTWQAEYHVHYGSGDQVAVVDQLGSRGKGIWLGDYYFTPDFWSPYVFLSDYTGETDTTRHVAVGNMWAFQPIFVHFLPLLIKQ